MFDAVKEMPGVIDGFPSSLEMAFGRSAHASVNLQMKPTVTATEVLDVVTTWGEALDDDSSTLADIEIRIGEGCRLAVDGNADDPRLPDTADFFVALCNEFPQGRSQIELIWYGRHVTINTQMPLGKEELDALAEHVRGLPGAQVDDDSWRIFGEDRVPEYYRW